MAPALRMPALGSSMMSLPATLRLDLACTIMELNATFEDHVTMQAYPVCVQHNPSSSLAFWLLIEQ